MLFIKARILKNHHEIKLHLISRLTHIINKFANVFRIGRPGSILGFRHEAWHDVTPEDLRAVVRTTMHTQIIIILKEQNRSQTTAGKLNKCNRSKNILNNNYIITFKQIS